MSPKTLNILYWSLTILFALMMLMDGGAGLAQESNGQKAMHDLGYPLYAMSIMGLAKVLGALALLQPWFRTIKEWAFAGFTINFLGAAASQVLSGAGVGMAVPALVMLAVLLLLYFLWKKYEVARTLASLTFGCNPRVRTVFFYPSFQHPNNRGLQPKVSEAKVRATSTL